MTLSWPTAAVLIAILGLFAGLFYMNGPKMEIILSLLSTVLLALLPALLKQPPPPPTPPIAPA